MDNRDLGTRDLGTRDLGTRDLGTRDLGKRVDRKRLCHVSFALPLILSLFVLVWPLARAAPAAAEDVTPWTSWQATGLRDHTLVGRIWSTARNEFVSSDELARALAATSFVLLGEIHDNPDHHRLQAWAIDAIVAAGRRPPVVFEMLNSDQQDALDRFRLSSSGQADQLSRADAFFTAVSWEQRGWPDRALYRPIIDMVIANELPIRVGDAPRAMLRALSRGGPEAPTADELARLKLDLPLSVELTRALDAELVAAHCGMLPEAALAPMGRVQRLRDAVLADNLIKAARGDGAESADATAGPHGAVLIAGSGHVRTDRAVPWYLRAHGIGSTAAAPAVLSLAMVEVSQGLDDAAAEATAYDYVWFTPRMDRPDPCEALRKQFGKPTAN